MIELNAQQKAAVEASAVWFDQWESADDIFRLFGYAGTGKSTTVEFIQERLNLKKIGYAVYTGKGALVLRKMGLDAQTIHSLVYKYVPPNKALCEELYKRWEQCEDRSEKQEIKKELSLAQKPHFVINENSPLLEFDLLVIDECSMVNHEMRADLESFGIPLLVLGDPGQLPPIEGGGALISGHVHAMLTEIHRQAEGNPIIDFSVRARNGIHLPYVYEGAARVIPQSKLRGRELLECDQVLVGKNKTRRDVNRYFRNQLFEGALRYPLVGDRLICLRNEKLMGLYNGLQAKVLDVGDIYEHFIELKILLETGNELTVQALLAHFDEYEEKGSLDRVRWWERTDCQEFDFSYAITVHKAQGSQWDNVYLMDDKMMIWRRPDRARWLYTGITRAAETLTIVRL